MIMMEFYYREEVEDDWQLGGMLSLPDGTNGEIYTINSNYFKVEANIMTQEEYDKFKLQVTMITNGMANEQKYQL